MAIRTILIGGAALALVGCATETGAVETAQLDTEEVDPRRGDPVGKICFVGNINGFGETTRNTVVVREGRDRYLIETFGGCYPRLDDAQSIAFDSFSGCLTRGDGILSFDTVFADRHHAGRSSKCTIKQIYAWDPDAAKDNEEEVEEASTET